MIIAGLHDGIYAAAAVLGATVLTASVALSIWIYKRLGN